MQDRHLDRSLYFQEQSITTEKYVISFIEEVIHIGQGMSVAEIGCGEGGNLLPFLNKGCKVTGIDISKGRIDLALNFFSNHPQNDNIRFINKNIYDVTKAEVGQFDLVFLRDTLEHINDHNLFFSHISQFIKTNGKLFLSFPPWRMPFGGHQQICHNKILSKLPYFHILPMFLYKVILKAFGESQGTINALAEIKLTRISVHKFYRLLKGNNSHINKITFFLINPNYETKFKLKPRTLPVLLNIPFIRDFCITTIYCIISFGKNEQD